MKRYMAHNGTPHFDGRIYTLHNQTVIDQSFKEIKQTYKNSEVTKNEISKITKITCIQELQLL